MTKQNLSELKEISKLIRYWILQSTSEAGSGHPTSCLSAVELMVALFFTGIFHHDFLYPKFFNNDRLIFSKGHAAPLLYALYAAAGVISPEELFTLREFTSRLEGHPTPQFPYAEAATGSLGQGLSIGAGMALNAKYLDKLSYKTFVLLGDSEMAEGSVWEAIQLASHYKLNNLIAILDVNRLGQCGETMYEHDLRSYQRKFKAFDWTTHEVDGHDLESIYRAYSAALLEENRPTVVIAKTLKGKGVSFLENKGGWHGKSLSSQELKIALKELGPVDTDLRGHVAKPEKSKEKQLKKSNSSLPHFAKAVELSTRQAYGQALTKIGYENENVVCLDAEVSNSTFAEIFKKNLPERFFEMFIAEQNMLSMALGLSIRGKVPFVSTFAAFLTRAHDQIRMAQYSRCNLKIVGSHSGVSLGEDGPSQMGLGDIAMFRSIPQSIIFYPSDAVSTEKLVRLAASIRGMVYIRTTRAKTPQLYSNNDKFVLGGSNILKKSSKDRLTIIAAGITLHEALKAYESLKKQGIYVRIVDLYSVKPLDKDTLSSCAADTKLIITVEDHHPEGGLGEAVTSALVNSSAKIHSLAVRFREMSGSMDELLDYEDISAIDIETKVKELLNK